MSSMTWDKAIERVLSNAGEAMHYSDIAAEVEERNYRTKLGATPANSVNMTINKSINDDGENSKYVRLGKGMYTLRMQFTKNVNTLSSTNVASEKEKIAGVIQCLGMYWRWENVDWKSNPKLLGQETPKADAINFCEQTGIYLLHDRDKIIYVGKVDEPRMGQRLFEHTKDRLNARWDRFSWFGLRPISENGTLGDAPETVGKSAVIAALEAILIEALESPQNRRRGDQLSAVEYIQIPKPAISEEKAKAIELILKGS